MQRGVLQALNPLPNRVTFTAIVPGAYPGQRVNVVKKPLIHSRVLLKTSHSPPIYRYISEMVEDSCCEAFDQH